METNAAIDGEEYEGRESALLEATGLKTIRTKKYRYASWANGRELLYDIENEHHEYHNVANEPSYADVLSQMRHKMLKHLIGIERPRRRIWAY